MLCHDLRALVLPCARHALAHCRAHHAPALYRARHALLHRVHHEIPHREHSRHALHQVLPHGPWRDHPVLTNVDASRRRARQRFLLRRAR